MKFVLGQFWSNKDAFQHLLSLFSKLAWYKVFILKHGLGVHFSAVQDYSEFFLSDSHREIWLPISFILQTKRVSLENRFLSHFSPGYNYPFSLLLEAEELLGKVKAGLLCLFPSSKKSPVNFTFALNVGMNFSVWWLRYVNTWTFYDVSCFKIHSEVEFQSLYCSLWVWLFLLILFNSVAWKRVYKPSKFDIPLSLYYSSHGFFFLCT